MITATETDPLKRSSFYLPDRFHNIEEIDEVMSLDPRSGIPRSGIPRKIEFDSIDFDTYCHLIDILIGKLSSEFGYHRIEERPEFRYYATMLSQAMPGDFDTCDYDYRNVDDMPTDLDLMDLNFIEFINLTYGLRDDEGIEHDFQWRIEQFKKTDIGYSHRPLYPYLKSWTYSFSPLKDDLKIALESGYEAITDLNDPNMCEHFANVLVKACQKYGDIEIYSGDEKISRDELAQFAIDRINEYDDPPGSFDIALGRLHALVEEFDKAEGYVTSGVMKTNEQSLEHRSILNEITERRRLAGIQQEVDTVDERLHSIKDQQEEVNASLKDAISEFNQLDEEMEDLTNRHRRQFVQYLGFFSGILAIAVTSTNIITNASSFTTASRLILTMAGGFVIAFSSLNLTIYEEIDRNNIVRTLISFLTGSLLIAIPFLLQ